VIAQPGDDLLRLRRKLAWEGMGLDSEFHATTDKQIVRDRVFALLANHDLRIDSTILEKAKAQPSIRVTDERFYQMAWYIARVSDELLVVSASVGTKKKRAGFHAAVRDVIRQVSPTFTVRVAAWDAASDPCLQIADYCAWAIQRKWESADDRSHKLIADKIATEFAPFRFGPKRYY
jgi:hypothetical protein